jgi:hypothetical protein
VLAVLTLAWTAAADAQLPYKCKKATGTIEYSDKPCPLDQEPVAWRPKYTGEGEQLAKPPEKEGGSKTELRKSAYTQWLDSQEEKKAKP